MNTPHIPSSSFPTRNWANVTPDKLKSGPSSKPPGFRPSPRNWNSGGTSCCNSGGSVYLIMFKTRHALLLPGGRILRPRSGRNNRAEQPRNGTAFWPQTRHIHEPGQARYKTRTRTIRVRIQSAGAFSPGVQSRSRFGRAFGSETTSPCPKLGTGAEELGQQTVRILGQSEFLTPFLPGTFHEIARPSRRSSQRIAVDAELPISFQVRVRILPTYDHV